MARGMVISFVAAGCAAAIGAGAFYAVNVSREKQARQQQAEAGLHALERRCVTVRYRLSQRQTIDLAGRRSDQDFIDQRCAPAHF